MIISLAKIGGGSASSMKYLVVTELPTVGKVGIIYLIESEDPQEGDKFNEYIWLKDEGTYEKLGKMPKIDLDDYYTKGEVDERLSGKVDYTEYENKVQEIEQNISYKVDYSEYEYKVQEIDENFYHKQDTLESGVNIKTINGEDILGNGDITVSGGDEHFKYNPTEEFTDGIVVYKEEKKTKLEDNKEYPVKSRWIKVEVSTNTDRVSFAYMQNYVYYTFGGVEMISDTTLSVECSSSNALITIYKDGILFDKLDYIHKRRTTIEVDNFDTSNLLFKVENPSLIYPQRFRQWGSIKVYEVEYHTDAYLATNGDKKEIALKEDIAALEEQIGDINNALETIIG